jgi:hypothetical protein
MTIRWGLIATLTERTEGANHASTSSPFAREGQIADPIYSLRTARWPCLFRHFHVRLHSIADKTTCPEFPDDVGERRLVGPPRFVSFATHTE